MKKLLVGTAAIAMGLALAAPANAQVSLDLSGHFKGYVVWHDQDGQLDVDGDGVDESERRVDILRETELHFSGETTLDNGMTVGVHVETDIDNRDAQAFTGEGDAFDTEEAYAYFSGAWGRFNFGKEDGAAYLLQVSAPSADSNVDGLRQFVNGINYTTHHNTIGGAGDLAVLNTAIAGGLIPNILRFDYDNAVTAYDNKVTYLTPIYQGFQVGVSFTPEHNRFDNTRGLNGVNLDDVFDDFGEVWEGGIRWEGSLGQLGTAVGAGYAHHNLEDEDGINLGLGFDGLRDERDVWNGGLDVNWGAFGLGFAFTHDDLGIEGDADNDTFVVGADYTTGPWKFGLSYLDADQELQGLDAALETIDANTGVLGGVTLGVDGANDLTGELDVNRWSGGVVYTYGPGMTFRGSVSYVDHELPPVDASGTDFDATTVYLGTQINF